MELRDEYISKAELLDFLNEIQKDLNPKDYKTREEYIIRDSMVLAFKEVVRKWKGVKME